ncbi:hypothetical protein VF04_20125, partial [Nostoc linckia z7]
AAINRLNKRLDNLERKQNDCCENKNNNSNSNLEKRVSRIESYINALHKDLDAIGKLIKDINNLLEPALILLEKMGTVVLKAVTAVTSVFGGGGK